MQAGEEFGRTKLGEDNSYRSAPEINMLRWSQVEDFGDLVEYYKGLIRLRKRLPGLCDKSPSAFVRITDQKICGEGIVSFRVDNRSVMPPARRSPQSCRTAAETGKFWRTEGRLTAAGRQKAPKARWR